MKTEQPVQVDDLCDYIIIKCNEAGCLLSNLKLQKLLYYADAWHLAFYGKKLINVKFQAWIHGPVNREVFDRFAHYKSLYSDIGIEDTRKEFDISIIEDSREHVDKILEAYGKFTGSQLEDITHKEEPWLKAREGYRPSQRCEEEIDDSIVEKYYRSRLS
jgi:uncharacterized phage-associated protein